MLNILKAGHMCGAGSRLNLHNVQSFLCCHFDLVILKFGKLMLREDDASQNYCLFRHEQPESCRTLLFSRSTLMRMQNDSQSL